MAKQVDDSMKVSKKSETKLRLLYLAKILYEETDKHNTLSTNDLIKRLQDDYGISSHRTTIAEDVDALIHFGMEIKSIRSSQTLYYVEKRKFSVSEIRMLTDFISGNVFFSEKKSKTLIKKLGSLISKNQKEEIDISIAERKAKQKNDEKLDAIINVLNEAITYKNKVKFKYYEYGIVGSKIDKIYKNDGLPYKFSPYSFRWNDGKYYIIGFSDKHNKVASFRIDKIDELPVITEEHFRIKKDFDVDDFVSKNMHMYDSKHEVVKLKLENDCVKAIYDKFGSEKMFKMEKHDSSHVSVELEVAVNHIFYSWIFGFGGKVKILEPEAVKKEYKQRLNDEISNIGDKHYNVFGKSYIS